MAKSRQNASLIRWWDVKRGGNPPVFTCGSRIVNFCQIVEQSVLVHIVSSASKLESENDQLVSSIIRTKRIQPNWFFAD